MTTPTKKKKEKMCVFDVDDTVANFLGYLCTVHNKIHGTCIMEKDLTSWEFANVELKDAMGNIVKGNEVYATFKRFENHGLYNEIPLLDDAKHALDLISLLGYKITLLTARDPKFGESTYLYFLTRGIKYDKLIFDWDKAKVINQLSEEYKVVLFADDKLSTIETVAKKCNVDMLCLVDKAHNQTEELDDNIKRVEGIFECVRFLKKAKN